MRLIAGLSIAFLVGATSDAGADDEGSYSPQIAPQCELFEVPGVGEVCGFADVEDWKNVLRVDAELVSSRIRLRKKGQIIESLTLQVAALEGQVDEYQTMSRLLQGRNDELTDRLIDTNERYEQERARFRLGSPVAWTVAAVLGSALVGYVGNDLL